MKDKMPLSEIRCILERGEWWDNVRDVSPDEPCLWMDELNGAIEAALEKLATWEDMQKQGRLVELPCKIGERMYEVHDSKCLSCDCQICTGFIGEQRVLATCAYYVGEPEICSLRVDENRRWNIKSISFGYEDIPKAGKTVFLTAQEAETALKSMEVKA